MPILASLGAGAIGAYRLFRSSAPLPVYIEEVFSTYLYTGTGATQSFNNGIDLAGKGGLVWLKRRNTSLYDHALYDTARGTEKRLTSNNTNPQADNSGGNIGVTAFNTTGFNLGATNPAGELNESGGTYASWTFRKQAKFFDVVTYTGNGSSTGQIVNHNLTSTPGFLIVKRTDSGGPWICLAVNGVVGQRELILNLTNGGSAELNDFGDGSQYISPNSNNFTVRNNLNTFGATYVAYLFAHNAGGFGAAGSDNVISCGSYVGNGSASGVSVNLGYEPQWVLRKRTDSDDSGNANWLITDIMRGIAIGSIDRNLYTNLANSEAGSQNIDVNATGFTAFDTGIGGYNQSGATYIYIAIRRGPMKTPTSGTDVFSLASYTGNGSSGLGLNSGIVSDAYLVKRRTGATSGWKWMQRLISYPPIGSYGPPTALDSTTTANESATATWSFSRNQNYNTDYFEVAQDSSGNWFVNGSTYINYALRRAPGFFDVVCYTGTGANANINHNLGVAPELLITKNRNGSPNNWAVWAGPVVSAGTTLFLDGVNQLSSPNFYWGTLATYNMTSTTFSLGSSTAANALSSLYVAYLFASCPGVSKVGSYTGTGALQTINCGFAAGARFVLIKRTDSTGDWWTYDSARGITSGNDPYLFMNTTAVEVTNTNYVDTASTGFQVTAAAPAGLNANGGTYIFLAIA